jgi:hypothetical protein
MTKPWKKTGGWPRVGKKGRKSYQLGFYDHEGKCRSKSFHAVKAANGWIERYAEAERLGKDSLRRFILDLDAKEQNVLEARTIGEVIELYFALDADPQLESGLAPSTFKRYRDTANVHLLGRPTHNPKGDVLPPNPYAVALACQPAIRFNEPEVPRDWREAMVKAGVPKPTRTKAWAVLSAALSWAAGSKDVPDITTNGAIAANERTITRRRSARRGGTGRAAAGRRSGSQVPSWALSPKAVHAIRLEMLARLGTGSPGDVRDPILALRDAMIVSVQHGLGCRNQEVYGCRWMSMRETFAEIVEVVSYGQLDEWGKTEHSAQRRCSIPGLTWEDLLEWRAALRAWGHPARDVDFVFPGDLGGNYGVIDERTGACHFSGSQASKWGPKFFNAAVAKVAQRDEFSSIAGATPYALRRGGISLRLRAEDAQTVAQECGTSLQMLDRHYAFAIDDLRRFGPRPVDVELREARGVAAPVPSPPEHRPPEHHPSEQPKQRRHLQLVA